VRAGISSRESLAWLFFERFIDTLGSRQVRCVAQRYCLSHSSLIASHFSLRTHRHTIDQSCPWVHFVHLVLRQLGPVTYEIQRNERARSWIVHVDIATTRRNKNWIVSCQSTHRKSPATTTKHPISGDHGHAVSFANHNASGTESHAPCIYVLFY